MAGFPGRLGVWATVQLQIHCMKGATCSAIPEVTALVDRNTQLFSGVREGGSRRKATREIDAIDTFGMEKVSDIGFAVGRRDPCGAASRAAWISWVFRAVMSCALSHWDGILMEVGISPSQMSRKKGEYLSIFRGRVR